MIVGIQDVEDKDSLEVWFQNKKTVSAISLQHEFSSKYGLTSVSGLTLRVQAHW